MRKPDFSKLIMVVILIVFLAFFAGWLFSESFSSPEQIESFVGYFQELGTVIIILLIVAEVVIAPIPGFVLYITTGFLYGPWLGTLFTWIGNVVGASIAFFISRRLGRPFVEKFVKLKKFKKYDVFFEHKKKFLWIFYVIPFFPIDILSFACGLSNLRFRYFITVVALAVIPNIFIFNYFGEQLFTKNLMALFMIALFTVIISAILFLFVQRIRKK
jgi:uncharacterized membrane protein YdjX (TVP38/TMEM64 family)